MCCTFMVAWKCNIFNWGGISTYKSILFNYHVIIIFLSKFNYIKKKIENIYYYFY
jgi:hypothetical protein